MHPTLSLLPATLIALLFASPALSEPVSHNHPLRAIALHAPKPPEQPVCCLRPLPPLEPVDDHLFLSFEEWKAKQSAIHTIDTNNHSGHTEIPYDASSSNGSEPGSVSADAPTPHSTPQFDADISPAIPQQSAATEQTPPAYRIPLTDRFNYASLDCSARVHFTHKSAKSPASILSSKKDRYMLSPCTGRAKRKDEKQFVVVELCDDIRIDTVQLANYEFFSGVFKDFTVSVAKTSTGADAWTVTGTFRAKNIRGVQSFHLPPSLRDFYRYIRIEFHSHYGNEFYCPVSLLRVYGLTHLEEWKWEVWEEESRAKLSGNQQASPAVVETQVPAPEAHAEANVNGDAKNDGTVDASGTVYIPPTQITATKETGTPIPSPSPKADITEDDSNHTNNDTNDTTQENDNTLNASNDQNDEGASGTHSTDTYFSSSLSSASVITGPELKEKGEENGETVDLAATSSVAPVISVDSSASIVSAFTPPAANTASATIPSTSLSVVGTVANTHPPPSAALSSVSLQPSIVSHSTIISLPVPAPLTGSGESIYRTIMNRLTALQTNHTLFAVYIEQQNHAVREVIARLGEDIGRLEGIGRARQVALGKAVAEWERERVEMGEEARALAERVEYLTEEIIMEKRLGIAQLLLLLAVLIFMGLTRGSRGEYPTVVPSSAGVEGGVREWGRRHFKLSSEWGRRFRRSKSSDIVPAAAFSAKWENVQRAEKERPAAVSAKSFPAYAGIHTRGDKIEFPTQRTANLPLEPISLNTPDTPHRPRTSSASTSRTPRKPHFRPITPTRPTFSLHRSNSQGASSMVLLGNVPQSAKRWARTAHLHQVTRKLRKDGSPLRNERADENGRLLVDDVVFSAPPGVSRMWPVDGENRKVPEGLAPLSKEVLARRESGITVEGESDTWVDTDSVDGSEVDFEFGAM
ncbi:UNC-like C-terminal-domain-containing protein [Cyathus striatus]|nr:UNC-like C-terminal-domain-containing protein [Cyathus striatus]